MRRYGQAPFGVAVIHGGPGAAGEVAPVARGLSNSRGVLEPFQTADTLDGQVEELATVLAQEASAPAVLVGHSWGAWLSLLVAARHPEKVGKVILVACAPFDARYESAILSGRISRLNDAEQAEYWRLMLGLTEATGEEQNRAMTRLGLLISRADAYELIPGSASAVNFQADLYQKVWREAAVLRSSGRLLEEASRVRCPVVAIHGADDPHPAEGVEEPLSAALDGFRLILLQRCGHQPWLERWARDDFFQALEAELA